MDEIIWDGSEQEFTEDQLAQVDVILALIIGFGRVERCYNSILKIFLPNIGELLVQGYIVHHIDGDPSNDHPSNLMVMLRKIHSKLHKQQWWECLLDEEYEIVMQNYSKAQQEYQNQVTDKRRIELNEANRRGQVDRPESDRKAHRQAQSIGQFTCWSKRNKKWRNEFGRKISIGLQEYNTNISQERRDELANINSKSHDKYFIESEIFINAYDNFTIQEFIEVTGRNYYSAYHYLSRQVHLGKLSISKRQNSYQINIYKKRGIQDDSSMV